MAILLAATASASVQSGIYRLQDDWPMRYLLARRHLYGALHSDATGRRLLQDDGPVFLSRQRLELAEPHKMQWLQSKPVTADRPEAVAVELDTISETKCWPTSPD